ncbi:hypothetical protein E2C01_038866 [Portunus trituberculatus]|uniref:Uncharacterized protein n=1 Tax=Portunus trituberculatus TaxID=210409 RepID=A0A5B7FI19_PORTR|nr:hypothetical protein [Portunus trituberculatus]
MSKLGAPYSLLGREYATQENYPTKKWNYFFLGFITALVMTLLGGTAFQVSYTDVSKLTCN